MESALPVGIVLACPITPHVLVRSTVSRPLEVLTSTVVSTRFPSETSSSEPRAFRCRIVRLGILSLVDPSSLRGRNLSAFYWATTLHAKSLSILLLTSIPRHAKSLLRVHLRLRKAMDK
ncbi:hypothetical protein AcW1_007417 [Taiwanofungus camphoratus]|nr:hypothetical protein AcW2_007522 [Antrodia cinnamomea]KAI0947096.1 hypothetical protein AcV7_009618 [Antrodia cinnamomea]KAI0953102.1 hypothetical protein AcW1_007417 [Antrodia cinnamomea]